MFAGNETLLSCPLYGPTCVIDENIPTDPAEVFTTDAAITYPWFEVELKLPARIIGVELSHHLQLEQWHDVHIRAGMTSTAAADGSTPTGLLTDIDLMAIYKGLSLPGTVNYVTFAEPVEAKYILVQGNWDIAKHLTLSEMKVIESKIFHSNIYHTTISILILGKTCDDDPDVGASSVGLQSCVWDNQHTFNTLITCSCHTGNAFEVELLQTIENKCDIQDLSTTYVSSWKYTAANQVPNCVRKYTFIDN